MADLTLIDVSNKEQVYEFVTWLGKQQKFPFEIYMNGITYGFREPLHKEFFLIGFFSAVEILDKLGEEMQ